MSDEMSTTRDAASSAVVSDEKQGFLSTAAGKVVAIVVGLGVLGVVAGVAVAVVLGAFASRAVEELGQQVVQEVVESSQVSTGTVSTAAEAPALEVANSAVFTFRDIFVPLLKPLPEPTAATDTTTTVDTPDAETPYALSILYLDGVVTEDGIQKAKLRLDGKSYTLGPGEGISGTPWEVLRVSSTSVTMLFGDIQVTLAVGQGITK